jgi:hypothetical protein
MVIVPNSVPFNFTCVSISNPTCIEVEEPVLPYRDIHTDLQGCAEGVIDLEFGAALRAGRFLVEKGGVVHSQVLQSLARFASAAYQLTRAALSRCGSVPAKLPAESAHEW